MTSRYYITTPIYYVNGSPHIGHAYTSIAADVMARWARLEGRKVFFLTGTDEHGQKVEKAAQDAGVTPQAFTDEISAQFRAVANALDVSYDDFIRTTEPRHYRACTALWEKLAAHGDIYLGHYEGWYALRDETFYDEDELTRLADGARVAPTGAPVEWVREPNYLFRLSAYQDRLLAHYEANPGFIEPLARRNEVVSFVRAGLRDLSVSRSSISWGIPVPGDPQHVMYVWLDALTNYLSAVGYPDEQDPRWPFWPADVHLVGKEIARFHAIYWPAFLMAAGVPLPRRVFSHGWWTVEGQKMSKSLGNVIDPLALAATYGVDPLRYFLLREVPFGSDGDFSRAKLVTRLNVELANDLGNLAQRTLSLIARNCGGRLPARAERTDDDEALISAAEALPGNMAERPRAPGAARGLRAVLARHPRCERLYRPPSALGAAQDRPGAHGSRPARPRRRSAERRHRAAAVHARQHGAYARPTRRSARRPHALSTRRAARRRDEAPATPGRVPAPCRGRGVAR